MNEEIIINRLARAYGVSPHTIRGLSIDKAQLLLRIALMIKDPEEKVLSPKRRIKPHKL